MSDEQPVCMKKRRVSVPNTTVTGVAKLASNSHDNSCQPALTSTTRRSGRSVSASTSREHNDSHIVLFPRDECIFCCKGRKKVKREYECLSTCVTEKAEVSIKKAAEEKADFQLLGKISGIDLRAREARYHESCRKAYVRADNREHHRPSIRTQNGEQDSSGQDEHREYREAHAKAFEHICKYVESSLLGEGNAETMTMLRDRYVTFLQQYIPGYTNDQFRTARLKERMMKHFGNNIKFWLPNKRTNSELVFPADLNTGEAVETAFEATSSETRVLAEAATILRRNIETTFKNAEESQWPPTASYLQTEASKPPHSLTEFLTLLLTGRSGEQSSDKTRRLCRSFAEDLCSATTRGQWSVPKHQLLGLTLHHLTGKAEVVTILHRYGHCTSYTGVMELETAMANQVQQQGSLLPSNISTTGNKVCHLSWDNFDLNEETPSGSGTTHTTHGILIQEIQSDCVPETQYQCVPKSKARSFKSVSTTPLASARKSNAEPSFTTYASSEDADVDSSFHTDVKGTLWTLCRAMFNSNWTVPEWSGWLSKTCEQQNHVIPSRIGYMKPILHPITDCATVKECLAISMEVTHNLSQEFTLVTMDLAAAKLAYDLVWADTQLYEKVVVNLGPFHTMCSYMGSLGKMMSGSGFEDIVVEAGLCASGSIEHVMSGKHYNRSMRVHQLMLDALERMLLRTFQDNVQLSEGSDSLSAAVVLASEPSAENLHAAAESENCKTFLKAYENFKASVRQGAFGKTAQFWLQYCDSVWTLLMFLRAVKENDLDLFVKCMRKMCGLLFSADHLNYGKYLPVYYTQLCNLQKSHPGAEKLIRDCGFSVARSVVPGCRIPIDQTIEQTVNRSAKTSGGIIGFSRNAGAYHRWCLTRHKRATYVEATLEQLDMVDDCVEAHKSTRPSAMKRSELEVSRVISTFDHFLNPFTTNEEHHHQLFCLSSGQPASENVAEDLTNYVEAGDRAATDFIDKRLLSHTVKFHYPTKKMKMKTFQAMAVQCTMTSSKKKTVQVKAERNLLGSLLMLSQRQEISLERLFQSPIGPIPWALATADGAIVKTDKAQLLHAIEALVEQEVTVLPENSVHVIDGNALLQSIVRLPETFEGLASFIFNCLPATATVHFVTDTYLENSLKQSERLRRGSSPTYLIGGGKTRLPRDFKTFLHNSENKRQLTRFLLTEWKSERYAARLHGRSVFFVCEKDCFCLHSDDGISVSATPALDLVSDQEEADTRIVLHCLHAAQRIPSNCAIVVRSPDTDVFVLLLHYSCQIPHRLIFSTGSGNNKRLLDVHSFARELDSDICAALPSFHVFTGCDTTSAFVRKGKRLPFKLLCKNQHAVDAFKSLGTSPDVITETTVSELEKFVCCMYGKSTYDNVDKLRFETFKSRYDVQTRQKTLSTHSGIDISLLPPCRSSLRKHCQRVNYQAYIWKHAHVAELHLPSPVGCGWQMDQDGKISIDWVQEALPQQCVEAISQDDQEEPCAYEYVEEDEVDNIIDAVFDEEDVEDDQ